MGWPTINSTMAVMSSGTRKASAQTAKEQRRPVALSNAMDASDEKLSQHEREEVEENGPAPAKVVHAAVSRQGIEELDRPGWSLFWSATAAGVAITASVWTGGALYSYAPDAPWRDAIVALGYPVGFLMVVLGRMQLFTEQTVVAILPLAREMTARNFGRVARLWLLVFLGNMIGAALAAAIVAYVRLQPEQVFEGMVAIAARLQEHDALKTFGLAIPAGFIMAAVAWIRSADKGDSFGTGLALTLAIALGGFAHVVAGASEAWLLLWTGEATLGWVLGGFILPALAGNVVGGTGLFAVLAHAQVKDEI